MKDWDKHYQEKLEEALASGNLLLDKTHAVMTHDFFKGLGEYSCSIPTGTFAGKLWKRKREWLDKEAIPCLPHYYLWILGMYGEVVGNDIKIHWREILLV